MNFHGAVKVCRGHTTGASARATSLLAFNPRALAFWAVLAACTLIGGAFERQHSVESGAAPLRRRGPIGDLLDSMRDQIEDSDSLIESWIEAFDMELSDDGMWQFDKSIRELLDSHCTLQEEHRKLIREWNKFVPDYNSTVAPRRIGRPLQAGEAQVAATRKLRKSGNSLRAIAAETGLGIRTVRTIVETDANTGRSSKRVNVLRKREFDRLRAAEYRARKKAQDRLPKRISQTLKQGDILIKAAKGLGG